MVWLRGSKTLVAGVLSGTTMVVAKWYRGGDHLREKRMDDGHMKVTWFESIARVMSLEHNINFLWNVNTTPKQ